MVFSLGMFHKDNDFKIYYASFFVHFFMTFNFTQILLIGLLFGAVGEVAGVAESGDDVAVVVECGVYCSYP